jgi:hypothetical protein
MNCNPLDAALIYKSQSHGLGVKPHLPQRFHATLLYLCNEFQMNGNGGVNLDAALLNISIAAVLCLLQIHHPQVVSKVDH